MVCAVKEAGRREREHTERLQKAEFESKLIEEAAMPVNDPQKPEHIKTVRGLGYRLE